MGRYATVAVCVLNQWALDFDGNLGRILQSIKEAKEQGATYRTGPELEITGYSCEDHFLEGDTLLHSWEVLLEILISPISKDILVDVGMPVMHKNITYNCRVVFLNKKILLIRPKLVVCDTGNYRETRWFSPWRKLRQVEDYYLPRMIYKYTGQLTVPFGDGVIATLDTAIGYEMCEELWSPESTHISLCLDGVEIIVNSSGSYTELRKTDTMLNLVKSATFKTGGCYLYSNLRGGDGGRIYFYGSSCICLNGTILNRSEQFSLLDVEVISAVVDLEDVHSYRNNIRSRSIQANSTFAYPRIFVPEYSLSSGVLSCRRVTTEYGPMKQLTPEEEILLGPACWLWDYLRRSGQGGYFLALSGGIDSSSVACIIFSMCHLIVNACSSGNESVLQNVRKIVCDSSYVPHDPKDLCKRLFVTCYMGTENSSKETRRRADILAKQIGSYHCGVTIDTAVSAVMAIFTTITGKVPRFSTHGGSARESLALQNIQARLRMVFSYLFAQLILWVQGRPGGLLVLGTGNVDEALRGYMTKYDCSSADVNPIGSISKLDLKLFLTYAKVHFNLNILDEIIGAVPTAELEPLTTDGQIAQTDEQDMGMTYEELNVYGKLRKQQCCGPYSMFSKLLSIWHEQSPEEISEKVKHFFRCYAINRHKMTVLTPAYHAEFYSPDDNRYDHRPFLYNATWKWQFNAIDEKAQQLSVQSSQQTLSKDVARHERETSSEKRTIKMNIKAKYFGDVGSSSTRSDSSNAVLVSSDECKSDDGVSRIGVNSSQTVFVQ